MNLSGSMPLLPGVEANATLSPCGTYRYLLTREWWPKGRGRAAFVMLNPSIADADQDDRTLRKCQKYARSWGFDGVRVVNLFALRATKPDDLYHHPDPIGEANDTIIDTIATSPTTGLVVVAWGQHGSYRSRGLIVLDRLRSLGVKPMRLGPATKGGHPWHPLYRPDDIGLEVA